MPRMTALFLFAVALSAFAQTGPTLIGSTYTAHNSLIPTAQVVVAPGQIATLQVTGLKTALSQPVIASQFPLPTVLGGFSVTIYQVGKFSGSISLAVPLLSVAQSYTCYPITLDCTITSITVEIPMETMPFLFFENGPSSQLVISENGVDSQPFDIAPLPANTHVLTGCGSFPQVACVTHADGSLVTATSPAQPSETVVIDAHGLGQTDPPVTAGAATPTPAPKAANYIYATFNFSPNAGPRYPSLDPTQVSLNTPVFAGLTPGEIGLYQLNVKLPDTFPSVPACTGLSPLYSAVQSNLTIEITTYLNLYGSVSDAAAPPYDAAPICVQPPATH